MGIPGGSDGKEPACNAGDLGSIPGLGRSPGGGHGNPLQSFLLRESPRTEEPGGLESMKLQRVEHDWATKHSAHVHTHTRTDMCTHMCAHTHARAYTHTLSHTHTHMTVITQAFKSKEKLRTQILFSA